MICPYDSHIMLQYATMILPWLTPPKSTDFRSSPRSAPMPGIFCPPGARCVSPLRESALAGPTVQANDLGTGTRDKSSGDD